MILEAVARAICSAHNFLFANPVAKGAFKETYLAATANGDPIALKVYLPGYSPERAVRELDAMVRCQHANIARLYAVSTFQDATSSHLFSVEEYIPGGSLTSLFQGGTLARAATIDLGRPLIDAVSHLETLRLVHRDIKPDNVMLRADRATPVLVDFGLVRDLNQSSLTQTWAPRGPGTALFASPEQLMNEKSGIDWRADQFSLGVVLSYAAFGHHPYSEAANDDIAAVQRVAARSAQSRRFLAAAAANGLSPVVRMTAPWPINRFRTTADLAAAWAAL